MRFILYTVLLNLVLLFVFSNPMMILFLIVGFALYYAYVSYQRSKAFKNYEQQYYQQDTYEKPRNINPDDIIDVEYTERDVTDRK